MKKETMSFKEFFQRVRPTYDYLQIIPSTSIRNYNSEEIAKTVIYMYKSVYKRFRKDGKKVYFDMPEKLGFFVDIKASEVEFYFICPSLYTKLVMEKCYEVWNRATIKRVDTINGFSDNAIKYQVRYSKEDALSIKIDKRLNQPLFSMLNVIDIMQDKDRVGVMINLMGCTQKNWLRLYDETIEKYKNKLPIDKEHGKCYVFKTILLELFNIIDEFLKMLCEVLGVLGEDKKKNQAWSEAVITNLQNIIVNTDKKISIETTNKRSLQVIDTQILVLSESEDSFRGKNNAMAVTQCYRTLDGDNTLITERVNNNDRFSFETYKYKDVMTNKMSTTECKHLLEIPGRELLNRYKSIDKIDVLESPLPEELKNGNIRLGEVKYKEKTYKAYLPSNYDDANLPLVLLSSMGGGKTTLICNMAMDAIKNDESVIVFDYIKNCELSQAIASVVPESRLIEIDCSDINNLQGFGYDEIEMNGATEMEKLDMANLQAQQTIAFINAINVDAESRGLTSQMRKLLRAAANITFYCGKKNIGNVIECLEDHRVRHEHIDIVNKDEIARNILRSEIMSLTDIDEVDKTGNVIGTKNTQALKGILDRIDDLQQDMRTKIMLNKECDSNVNFVDAMNEGKVILIKMPEDIFFSNSVKDMLTTYFCSKCILSIKLRSKQPKPRRCNIIIDELNQCEGAESWIKQTLSQTRKFGGKYILALHRLGQLKYDLDSELKACGSSFILLKGADKVNYNEFKEELDPYQLEDLQNLEKFSALNLIKTREGWIKFATKLPPEPYELKKLREA